MVDFQVLTEDYSKLVFACVDRSLVFHAKFGGYFSTRIPKAPRSIAYHASRAEVLAVGSSSDVYRLNLDIGRFMAPLPSASPGLNVARVCPTHGLLAAGGDDGALECFDMRQRFACTRVDDATAGGRGVTSLRFDGGGTQIAIGCHTGKVLLYDLRSSRPLLVRDHMYDAPIVDVKWHTGPDGARRIVSSDTRAVKIWDAQTGRPFTTVEPEPGVTDLCMWPGSGLFVLATEARRLIPYFVPGLGPAPRWCSFLENLTEEMEEQDQVTLYDDYRFVTRAELEQLGLTGAIGTQLLRPYMHGFFIDNRLYGKASALAAPFDYAAYRTQKAREKLEAERGSRITVLRKMPKVNAALAARLAEIEDKTVGGVDAVAEDDDGDAPAPGAATQPSLLKDQRFASIFTDTDFAIDETDPEYLQLHPNAPRGSGAQKQLLREHYQEAESDEEDGEGMRMYTARSQDAAAAFSAGRSLKAERNAPLGQRSRGDGGTPVVRRKRGAQSMSFRSAGGGEQRQKKGRRFGGERRGAMT